MQHLKDYKSSGKLKPENGGSEGFLKEAQMIALLAHLESHLYIKASDIAAHVHEAYGIRYSVRGMTDWLKRNGFTFHQPCGVPAKADAEAQQAFVTEYEAIKASLRDKDQIVFIDGVHPLTRCASCADGYAKASAGKSLPTAARNGSIYWAR